ncbi:MAG: glycosyltransferase [Bacteroidales bacterium]|nr:glycosyltransferase [Bacteroidales bacterium]
MQWLPAILIVPYLILLLGIYRGLRKINPYNISSEPLEFVSVIVACRNEELHLPGLLGSLSDQDYPSHLYEVIVVNDNSTDKTFETASSFSGKNNINTINNTGTGKKKAIETGINAASGKLIITTDADCTPGKNWIRTIASFYEDHKPDLIICPVQLSPMPGFFGKFQELEFLSLQGITAGTASNGKPVICNGANLAFTKESYLKHSENLHHEIASGDDVFLLHSIKKAPQSKILWLESANALITAASSPTIKSFIKQRNRWISKSGSIKDFYTIVLGIVTFVTILLQPVLLIAGIFDPVFLIVFLVVFALKSIPDFLILQNTTRRYGKESLMKWFLISQIIYPYYVLIVVLKAIHPGKPGIDSNVRACQNWL